MIDRKLNTDKIREKMDSLGLNQTELASKLNVSRESVSKWLKGDKIPRPQKLLALSKKLDLSFDEIISQTGIVNPIIAFRTNKKKKVSREQELKAKDMGRMLKVLLPYFNRESVFSPAIISNPIDNNKFIQKTAAEIRRKAESKSLEISFSEIMKLYVDFHIVLIPVMWGPTGNNGLYIHIPENPITFVYANLEKVVTDFKFWLLHELAHVMTPSLKGSEAEAFADNLAAAILFPIDFAKETYNELIKIQNKGIVVNRIKAIASKLLISPYTIINEMKKYAEDSSLPPIDIEMGGAITNFNKEVGLVSEIIFEKKIQMQKSILKYVKIYLWQIFLLLYQII